MTVGTESHSTGHSSGITTTTVAAVKNSTGNTRELYVLLDTGCSCSIFSDNYLNYVRNFKKSKSHYSSACQNMVHFIDRCRLILRGKYG